MSHIKLYTCLSLLISLLGKVYAIDNLDKILSDKNSATRKRLARG